MSGIAAGPPVEGGAGDDTHEGRVAQMMARLNGETEAPPAPEKVVVSDDEVKALMYRAMPVSRRSQEQREAQAAKDAARAKPGRRAQRDYELLVASQHAAPAKVVAPRIQSRPRERRGPSCSTRRARSAASSSSGSSDSDPPAAVAVSASLAGVS
jgi:hypothetical protein